MQHTYDCCCCRFFRDLPSLILRSILQEKSTRHVPVSSSGGSVTLCLYDLVRFENSGFYCYCIRGNYNRIQAAANPEGVRVFCAMFFQVQASSNDEKIADKFCLSRKDRTMDKQKRITPHHVVHFRALFRKATLKLPHVMISERFSGNRCKIASCVLGSSFRICEMITGGRE